MSNQHMSFLNARRPICRDCRALRSANSARFMATIAHSDIVTIRSEWLLLRRLPVTLLSLILVGAPVLDRLRAGGATRAQCTVFSLDEREVAEPSSSTLAAELDRDGRLPSSKSFVAVHSLAGISALKKVGGDNSLAPRFYKLVGGADEATNAVPNAAGEVVEAAWSLPAVGKCLGTLEARPRASGTRMQVVVANSTELSERSHNYLPNNGRPGTPCPRGSKPVQ